MKTIILVSLVACFTTFASLAGERSIFHGEEQEEGLSFKIISDKYDASIPEGNYVLEGKVLDDNSGKGISGVSITNITEEIGKSTKGGVFSIRFSKYNTQVAFVHGAYKTSYFESKSNPVPDRHRIKIEIRVVHWKYVKEYPAEKPVVYCYSDKPVDVSLKLNPSGKLFFSYPELNDKNTWNFTVSSDKMLRTAEGKQLPYLFWESINSNPIAFSGSKNQLEGEFVPREQIVPFLDSCLTVLNFNANEKTDFITYWGPRLLAEPYAFIHFLQNEQCEQFAGYEISPEPDAFYRLFMVFSTSKTNPVNLNLKKQELVPLKRSGFHLLEWGGIQYEMDFDVAD